MRKPFCFTILLASPSDVLAERDMAEKICSDWNSNFGEEKDVRLETKRWEKNLNIDSRKKAQSLVNQQMVAKSDILFAIFGKRFGTATEDFESGTLEEIQQIINSDKPYFIYFMEHQYSLDELDTTQVEKIKNFKTKLKEEGSFKNIADHDTFKREFLSDINYHVNLLLKDAQKNVIEAPNLLPNGLSNQSDDITLKENWYELSINELINNYLVENNQQFAVYKRGIM